MPASDRLSTPINTAYNPLYGVGPYIFGVELIKELLPIIVGLLAGDTHIFIAGRPMTEQPAAKNRLCEADENAVCRVLL